MTQNSDLRAEIEALRREVEAIRIAKTAATADEKPPTETVAEQPTTSFTDQLRTLANEISAVAEDTEKGVASHPLTSVLGALVLGILIGRSLPR